MNIKVNQTFINLCIRGNPITSTFANNEDPDEMQHYAAFHQSTPFVKVKNIFRPKNTLFLKIIT